MPTKHNQVINNLTALSNFSLKNVSVPLLLIDKNGPALSLIINLEEGVGKGTDFPYHHSFNQDSVKRRRCVSCS